MTGRKPFVPMIVLALGLAVSSFMMSAVGNAGEATIGDGDTLTVEGVRYRLHGIDAPEPDQVCLDAGGDVWPCGIEAREQLIAKTRGRDLQCDDKGPDRSNPNSDRRIGICRISEESVTLNTWLVRQGWALNFEPYAGGQFTADEAQAQRSRLGLWKGCFSTPQQWRRGEKSDAVLKGIGCEKKGVRGLLFPDHPNMPPGCSIKGTFSKTARAEGYRGIYHFQGCRHYQKTTNPKRWFCSEEEAEAAFFRRAKTCPKKP